MIIIIMNTLIILIYRLHNNNINIFNYDNNNIHSIIQNSINVQKHHHRHNTHNLNNNNNHYINNSMPNTK